MSPLSATTVMYRLRERGGVIVPAPLSQRLVKWAAAWLAGRRPGKAVGPRPCPTGGSLRGARRHCRVVDDLDRLAERLLEVEPHPPGAEVHRLRHRLPAQDRTGEADRDRLVVP